MGVTAAAAANGKEETPTANGKDDAQRAGQPQPKWHHVDRNFVSIKLIYFWCFAGAISILPLLTLHMTSLGLTLEDVAQVYVFMPVAAFMGPPIVGYIADRTGHIQWLYIGCLVMHCALHQSLLFVPPSPHTTPAALAVSANDSELACGDWPPPGCGSFGRGQRCRLRCPDGAGRLRGCAEDGGCRPAGANATLLLDLDSDGCVAAARLADNGSELALPALAQLSCPARCRLACEPLAGLPVSRRLTFWMYFFLRLCATFFLAPSFTLLDATNLALVKQHQTPGQNFGRQRVTGILASVIMPPLVGLLVDEVSGPEATNYAPAFYSLDLCIVLTIGTLLVCGLRVALPEKAHIREAAKILKRPEALVFILVVAVLGSMWGFLENFLFVFLKQLHAPTYMLGLTMTVAGLASMPFNWFSDAICNKVGHVNMLIAAFAGYTVRYVGYSFIRNPWLCFPFELLEVVTTHLMWNSAATYAGHLAPAGLLATLTGVAGALHYSFGRGVGSFIGGYLMALVGASFTLRVMGTVSGVCGVLYALVYYGCLRHRISRREERRRADKAKEKPAVGEDPHELAAMLEENAIVNI